MKYAIFNLTTNKFVRDYKREDLGHLRLETKEEAEYAIGVLRSFVRLGKRDDEYEVRLIPDLAEA